MLNDKSYKIYLSSIWEKYKTQWMISKNKINGVISYVCGWGRFNIVKMLVPPNLIYTFNMIHIEIQGPYFVDIEQTDFHKRQKIQNSKHTIEWEKQSWRADSIQVQDWI